MIALLVIGWLVIGALQMGALRYKFGKMDQRDLRRGFVDYNLFLMGLSVPLWPLVSLFILLIVIGALIEEAAE